MDPKTDNVKVSIRLGDAIVWEYEFIPNAMAHMKPEITVEQPNLDTPYGKALTRTDYRVMTTAAGPCLAVSSRSNR